MRQDSDAVAQAAAGPERPLSALEVQRSLRVNIIAGCLGMVWAACVFGMPLPLFMEAVGASGLLIGMVGAVNQVAMVFQVPGALIVERMAWRKPFWASLTLLHRLLWFLPALLPFVLPEARDYYPWLMVAIIFASAVLANTGSAAWQSWMADLVPARGGGQFWGLRQSWLTASSIVGVLGAGWLLDHVDTGTDGDSLGGFSLVFALAALFGLADIVVHLWVREPRSAPASNTVPLAARLAAPLRAPAFRRLTMGMGLWYFSVGLVGGFQFVYLKRDLGFTYTMTAQLSLLAAIGGTVSGFFFGALMDRIGAKNLSLLLVAAAPLCGTVWFLLSDSTVTLPLTGAVPQPMLVLGAMMVLGGALYAGVVLCQVRLTALASQPEGRTMSMAVHWTLVGLAGALGPLFGGAIMDFIDRHPLGFDLPLGGVKASFFHALVLVHMASAWLLVLPVLSGIQVSDRMLPLGAALGRVFVLNPLQAVRNIYNISMLSAAAGSRERAQTVRSLGRSKAALAVTDLIEQLDDPSLDVQEEAIASLGEIGDDEAVAALARVVANPDSLLRASAARALRRHAGRVPVEPLLDGLHSGDRETVCECARTLGEWGVALVAPGLRQILTSSEDPKVRICCANALGALGDEASLALLVEVWRNEDDPWRQEAIACAIADCFSERDSLYRLLERERKTPGDSISTLLGKLSRQQTTTDDALQLDAPLTRIAAAVAADDFVEAWRIASNLAATRLPQDKGLQTNPGAAVLLSEGQPPQRDGRIPTSALLLLLHALTCTNLRAGTK